MGFYGNITNASKVQFVFDRTYSNRKIMDQSANQLDGDGVYIGRYVLVDYDRDIKKSNGYDTFLKGQAWDTEKIDNTTFYYFYTSVNKEPNNLILLNGEQSESEDSGRNNVYVRVGDIIYTEIDETPNNNKYDPIQYFYICTGSTTIGDKSNVALFKNVTNTSEIPYTVNYAIDTDKNAYGAGRGYDSTVWQKVYENNQEKYVMIAELNSVVPTFDLTVDAPTMTPLTPHFDTDSNNVYYKLHVQPQWGFRVAEAVDEKNRKTPSDQEVKWQTSSYDPSTGKFDEKEEKKEGAIYFNKPAFDPQIDEKRNSEDGIKKKQEDENFKENYLTISPTGISGQLYNNHNKIAGPKEPAKDIQELKINLPAIGDMMSDAWDIIHGPYRNNDKRQFDPDNENKYIGSLQGRLDSIDAIGENQIPIKRAIDGRLVGTKINGNNNKTVTNILKETLLKDSFETDDAWIQTKIDENIDNDNGNNGISIHHTFTSTPSSTSKVDKNDSSNNDITNTNYKMANLATENINSDQDEIKLYVPYVDKAGHVVGHNIETVTLPYGYKSIQTNGRGIDTSIANDGEMSDQDAIVANHTQDILTINSGNKWIRIDTDATNEKITLSHDVHAIDVAAYGHTNLNEEEGAAEEKNLTLYEWEYDNAGHITAKKEHTYTLPFGFKIIEVTNSDDINAPATNVDTNIVADATQDTLNIVASNKWIKLDTNTEDTVKLGHLLSEQTPITVGNEALSPQFGESFKIPRFTTDEAGHIIEASNQKITLQAGSYTPADEVSESTEVITSIGFNAATGDITSTKADSSTLKLASYSEGTSTDDVADGDTYNSAFAKLQNQINGLDYSENNATQIITAINQVDGLISVTRGDAGTLLLTGYELKESEGSDADLLATDNLKTAFSKLQRQIHVEEAVRAAAIDALDVPEIITEPYEVISAVSEADGKISAKKKKAGTLTLSDYSKPSSGSSISQSDSLNSALGKLEYKLDAEIKRVDDLDYTDPNTNATQIITKVTQADGKIEVSRSNAGTLLLTDYTIGTNGEKIASTDSINIAFAKLQTQINNVIGNEEIATNFDNIKKISDWLSANDSNADQVIDDIATLKGDASTTGSVQNQIKTAIEDLDSEKTAAAGNYISGIHIKDGKIDSIDETALPEISWDDVTNKPTNLVEDTDIVGMVTESSNFTYPAITDSTGAEISSANTAMTIALLFEKVAALEARIYALENPVTNETPEPTPEEGGEETPTE